MRSLIDAREGIARPVVSGLEARFESLCRQAGLDRLRRQVDLGGEHDWIGRDDRHAGAGYEGERFDEFSVWHRPDEVIAGLRRLLHRLAA